MKAGENFLMDAQFEWDIKKEVAKLMEYWSGAVMEKKRFQKRDERRKEGEGEFVSFTMHTRVSYSPSLNSCSIISFLTFLLSDFRVQWGQIFQRICGLDDDGIINARQALSIKLESHQFASEYSDAGIPNIKCMQGRCIEIESEQKTSRNPYGDWLVRY